jgi:hypothetical protein
MVKIRTAAICVAMIVGIGSQAAAIAQDASPPAIDVLSPHLNAIEFGRQNAQAASAARGEYEGDKAAWPQAVGQSLVSNLGAPPSIDAAAVSTSFASDPNRTRQNLRNFIARTPNPAARANLQQMLDAQPTLMDDIAAGIRVYGFDPHDVADAYAVWWINAWGASQKVSIEPDATTAEAVRRQVRNAFAATRYPDEASDADRQQDAEALLVQAALLGSAVEQFKSNPKMLEQLAQAARKGAKDSFNIDLSTLTLTRNGFVPRKTR